VDGILETRSAGVRTVGGSAWPTVHFGGDLPVLGGWQATARGGAARRRPL